MGQLDYDYVGNKEGYLVLEYSSGRMRVLFADLTAQTLTRLAPGASPWTPFTTCGF